ncbi:hypothetical protein Sps_01502 [Shewanella psychrophila]|uniref:Lipoprotein n=1 Tax=Shewanella psychrophila TaxID=225848 RepID=A0A1S6HME8_9GAMM|nr:hypothetical protein [Shewanella psychrophila]AQS36668.1 hypothetical protein Sps_01502 [Shewanella psychrophila]
MRKLKSMLIMVISLVSIILLIGCENRSQLEVEPEQISVAEAIQEAEVLGDYRIYGTSGRRITLPGIAASDNEQAQALCGVQYMTGTGDVISSPEQRLKREQLLDFMTSYNQAIFEVCKKLLIK